MKVIDYPYLNDAMKDFRRRNPEFADHRFENLPAQHKDWVIQAAQRAQRPRHTCDGLWRGSCAACAGAL